MGDTIHVRGEGGSIFELGLPLHETIEDKLRVGTLTRVNADGSLFEGEPDDVPGLPAERPAVNAPKTAWLGWAVAQGADQDDAAAMTKADLIEKYGG